MYINKSQRTLLFYLRDILQGFCVNEPSIGVHVNVKQCRHKKVLPGICQYTSRMPLHGRVYGRTECLPTYIQNCYTWYILSRDEFPK